MLEELKSEVLNFLSLDKKSTMFTQRYIYDKTWMRLFLNAAFEQHIKDNKTSDQHTPEAIAFLATYFVAHDIPHLPSEFSDGNNVWVRMRDLAKSLPVTEDTTPQDTLNIVSQKFNHIMKQHIAAVFDHTHPFFVSSDKIKKHINPDKHTRFDELAFGDGYEKAPHRYSQAWDEFCDPQKTQQYCPQYTLQERDTLEINSSMISAQWRDCQTCLHFHEDQIAELINVDHENALFPLALLITKTPSIDFSKIMQWKDQNINLTNVALMGKSLSFNHRVDIKRREGANDPQIQYIFDYAKIQSSNDINEITDILIHKIKNKQTLVHDIPSQNEERKILGKLAHYISQSKVEINERNTRQLHSFQHPLLNEALKNDLSDKQAALLQQTAGLTAVNDFVNHISQMHNSKHDPQSLERISQDILTSVTNLKQHTISKNTIRKLKNEQQRLSVLIDHLSDGVVYDNLVQSLHYVASILDEQELNIAVTVDNTASKRKKM